jgi:2-isopropylmalate synthase
VNTERIVVFDTTLRDGEQSPGVNLNLSEKVQIAKALEKLGVDVIEAGFAAASDGDFAAIKAVARAVTDSAVCSLSRAVQRDIELSAEAVRAARAPRIHIVLATSPIHMKFKLQMEPEQVLDTAVRAVQCARRYASDVEFSCEDASRSDLDFLCCFVEGVIGAGATTISLPDTTGYVTPSEYGHVFTQLRARVPCADKVVWSAHCHDDLGMAVANSLAAVLAGAGQLECTINGIGERAGNAALEEIVMALRTRADFFGKSTRVDAQQLVPVSKLVSELTGLQVPRNKAIVGENAFRHESGIHQDGMLKNPLTYQIMRAQDVGREERSLVLGKLSGRNGFRAHMEALGVAFSCERDLDEAFARFKRIADRKESLDDDALRATFGR